MNRILLLIIILISAAAHAQIVEIDTATKWRKNFKAALNLNQASFSSNWNSHRLISSWRKMRP
ncbi:MAG: hypothetical protein ACKOAR_11145, partial [Bacteroidota bacterium]